MSGTGASNRSEHAVPTGAADAVRLPRLLVLTDRRQAVTPLVDVVAAAVDAGARTVVLREKDLPDEERRALAAELAPVVHRTGGVLLAAGGYLPAADGVHQPSGGGARVPGAGITGRSCHDADEVRAAEADGIDYVTVSPVHATASKPGYGPPLGTGGLASLVASTILPVYALGGIDRPAAVAACRSVGAHGVAVMGAIMRSRRPGPLVAELLEATVVDRA